MRERERKKNRKYVGTNRLPPTRQDPRSLRLDANSKIAVNCSPVDEVPNTNSDDSQKRAQEAAPAELSDEEPIHADTHGRHPRAKRASESLVRNKKRGMVKWDRANHGTKHGINHGTVSLVWLRLPRSRRRVRLKERIMEQIMKRLMGLVFVEYV